MQRMHTASRLVLQNQTKPNRTNNEMQNKNRKAAVRKKTKQYDLLHEE